MVSMWVSNKVCGSLDDRKLFKCEQTNYKLMDAKSWNILPARSSTRTDFEEYFPGQDVENISAKLIH